jgi:hypothetical protein
VALKLASEKLDAQKPEAEIQEIIGGRRLLRFVAYLSLFLLWVWLIFFATRGAGGQGWLAGWQRWDARWYEQIWRGGYPANDPRTLVFPPGYPFAIGGLSKLFSLAFFTTAVIFNLAVFFAAAVLISEWLSRKFSFSPYLLFVFVISAPTAYFAFTAYSDILFMLLLWLLFWLALAGPGVPGDRGEDLGKDRKHRYQIAIAECFLLFVLPWIRLTGYALASWLVARRIVALAVLASLVLWLAFNRAIAGSAFYFLHAQELFAMPRGNFFQGLADGLEHLVSDAGGGQIMSWLEFGFLPLFYLVVLTAAAIWLAKRGEGLLALSAFSILVLSYNQGFWRSAVRYDLPLTPLLCLPLLVTAKSASRIVSNMSRAAFYTLILAQFSLQIYFARIFHTGGWAF